MSEVIVEAPASRRSGSRGQRPNLAPEIAAEQPPPPSWRARTPPRRVVQKAISTRYLRPYTNDDVVGCELGGAVKNVIALAYGMAHGARLRRQHQAR
jgi:glycerol-3-phosphate dehydrogenase (NAD(P)+)